MFITTFQELEKLNENIDRVLSQMTDVFVESEEFAKLSDQLLQLTRIKETIVKLELAEQQAVVKEKEIDQSAALKKTEMDLKREDMEASHTLKIAEVTLKREQNEKPDRVSKDVLIGVAANLAGILVIIGYERFNVLASKALGFIGRR